MRNPVFVVLVVCGSALGMVACGSPDDRSDAGNGSTRSAAGAAVVVYTVNYPLSYFAARVGGDRATVVFPAPPDIDPAYWRPDPDTVGSYQEADVILRNGAGYASWVDTATLPASRVVDTSAGVADRLIEIDDAVTHSHGPGGEHDHGASAFTTWLDPRLAIAQADAARDAMSVARPEDAARFASGFDGLRADLEALDARLEAAFARYGEGPWLASHPVYQYLGRRYGLDLTSVHFEADEFPDEAGWRELEAVAEERDVRWMLWEAEPLPETRARLDGMGIACVVFEPCGNTPPAGDYLAVMGENAGLVEGAISP